MAEDISVREQILRAFVACLSGEGSPAEKVFRSKIDQIDVGADLPCFDVAPDQERDGKDFTDHDAWARALSVKVRACIDATDQDDGALDPLYLWAVRRIVYDPAILALVDSIEWTGADSVFRPAGKDILGLELSFDVTFAVMRGDPAQKG